MPGAAAISWSESVSWVLLPAKAEKSSFEMCPWQCSFEGTRTGFGRSSGRAVFAQSRAF